jgi:hypothetical protein
MEIVTLILVHLDSFTVCLRCWLFSRTFLGGFSFICLLNLLIDRCFDGGLLGGSFGFWLILDHSVY